MKKPKNEKIELLERFRKQGIKIFNLEEIKKKKIHICNGKRELTSMETETQ